jgi:hypothetical protein
MSIFIADDNPQMAYLVDVDPEQIRRAGRIAEELSVAICRLADEIAPASNRASRQGLLIGDYLRSVVPAWEDHLRAVCATVDGIGSALVSAADTAVQTDDDNAVDVNRTTTGTTVWPGY